MTDKQEEKPPLYIHVGLHKTGNTFLQAEVYPNLSSVQFLYDPEIRETLQRFAGEEDACFDLEQYQRYFDPLISAGPSLIAHEGLSGANYLLYINQMRTADRLAKLFPHAKIILGIRRQDTLLLSLYIHFIKGGASISLKDFLNYDKGKFRNRYDNVLGTHVNLPMFRYDHMANLYADRFDGRVSFLVYEQMSRDIQGFVQEFCQIIGEPEAPSFQNVRRNTSYGRYQYILARALNRFFYSGRNLDGLIPGIWLPGRGIYRFDQILDHRLVHSVFRRMYGNKVVMPEKISRAIMEYYAPSNAEFAKKWNLDLRSRGYIPDDLLAVGEQSGDNVGQRVEKTQP